MSYYIALGDSISIDLYPNDDAEQRWGVRGRQLGAASLLHRNDSELWPEFDRRDLATLHPGIRFANITTDGATIDTVIERHLPRARELDARIVTVTAGGNDLLLALSIASDLHSFAEAVDGVQRRFTEMVDAVHSALPQATLLLTTIYDPTDGTGVMPGSSRRLPIEFLKQTNEHIRDVASRTPGAMLADIHTHFMGHGIAAPEAERWYWPSSIIEPSARGASEVRRVWLEALGV